MHETIFKEKKSTYSLQSLKKSTEFILNCRRPKTAKVTRKKKKARRSVFPYFKTYSRAIIAMVPKDRHIAQYSRNENQEISLHTHGQLVLNRCCIHSVKESTVDPGITGLLHPMMKLGGRMYPLYKLHTKVSFNPCTRNQTKENLYWAVMVHAHNPCT